jgi:hypothetical protein
MHVNLDHSLQIYFLKKTKCYSNPSMFSAVPVCQGPSIALSFRDHQLIAISFSHCQSTINFTVVSLLT